MLSVGVFSFTDAGAEGVPLSLGAASLEFVGCVFAWPCDAESEAAPAGAVCEKA